MSSWNSDLSEKFYEVIHVCGSHGLGGVALVLEVVLAGVWSVDAKSVQRTRVSRLVALENKLNNNNNKPQ